MPGDSGVGELSDQNFSLSDFFHRSDRRPGLFVIFRLIIVSPILLV